MLTRRKLDCRGFIRRAIRDLKETELLAPDEYKPPLRLVEHEQHSVIRGQRAPEHQSLHARAVVVGELGGDQVDAGAQLHRAGAREIDVDQIESVAEPEAAAV